MFHQVLCCMYHDTVSTRLIHQFPNIIRMITAGAIFVRHIWQAKEGPGTQAVRLDLLALFLNKISFKKLMDTCYMVCRLRKLCRLAWHAKIIHFVDINVDRNLVDDNTSWKLKVWFPVSCQANESWFSVEISGLLPYLKSTSESPWKFHYFD